MFRSIGTTELLVVAGIILVFFGGKAIPGLFEGVAKAVKEFKKASEGTDKKEEK